MNVKEIKELIDIVARRGLGGLEIERAGFRLRIEGPRTDSSARPGARLPEVTAIAGVPAHQTLLPGPSLGPAVASLSLPAGATTHPAPLPATTLVDDTHVIKSPIVGTFYRSSNPDAEPYVKVGDHVQKGQTLCIVEAMKLMNEIESDASGTLLAIYPQNAQPVEFGEKLFAVKPD